MSTENVPLAFECLKKLVEASPMMGSVVYWALKEFKKTGVDAYVAQGVPREELIMVLGSLTTLLKQMLDNKMDELDAEDEKRGLN